MIEHRIGDVEGGYTLPASATSGSTPGAAHPDYPVSDIRWERILSPDSLVTVYTGATIARYYLPAATGSGLQYTVKNAGVTTADLTLDAGFNGTIDGVQTWIVAQGDAIDVVDYAPGLWAVLTPQIPAPPAPTPVIAYHAVADAAYVITDTTNLVVVGYSSITATRAVTLPLATTAGQIITVRDESGSCGWLAKITITTSGTNKIHDATATSVDIFVPRGSITFMSNGSGTWTITDRKPGVWYVKWLASTTFICPPDVVAKPLVSLQGGGGSGANGHSTSAFGGPTGGNSGSYFRRYLSIVANTSYTITIGAGGTQPANTQDAAGIVGGDSSFGTIFTIKGGKGGVAGATGSVNGTPTNNVAQTNDNYPDNFDSFGVWYAPTVSDALWGLAGKGAVAPNACTAGTIPTKCGFTQTATPTSIVPVSGTRVAGGCGAASYFTNSSNGFYNNDNATDHAPASPAANTGGGGGGGGFDTVTFVRGAAGASGFIEMWLFF